jgi:Na+/melibiose symporter-like transporter
VSKKIISIFISLSVFVTVYQLPSNAWAQAGGLTSTEKAELTGTRKQLATIVFSGLAGAILGLSTLSFHGRPQDHLSNIAVGFAVGIIGGAIFTTYKAATKPYEAYDMAVIYNKEIQNKELFIDEGYRRTVAQNLTEYTPALSWRWDF